MKKPTSIGPIDTNFGSVNDTKSMNERDPLTPGVNIARVSPSPFLFTRIQAKVDSMRMCRSRWDGFLGLRLRWVWF